MLHCNSQQVRGRQIMYIEQWIVGKFVVPTDAFARLCCARKANLFNLPITYRVWDFNNPDDMTSRVIPNDELCQCCETKLAIMCGNNLRKWDRQGEYQLIESA